MANDNFSKTPAKFLSIFVERMVPDYVREDHPMFITFLRKYFEYLERETDVNGELGEYSQITDLIQNVDIDHALDQFIPEFEKQYLTTTPHTAIDPTVPTTDKAFLAKNIQDVYRQKGTTSALNFLFRRDFNTDVNVIYPKQWLMKSSGSIWYEPKWITVLTDKETTNPESEYYNEIENVHTAETVRTVYNKKVIGQISGATAFIDMDESSATSDYEKLLLTEVSGEFIKGEPIWEDVGTSGQIPYVAVIISEGIETEGECIINGNSWADRWMHITTHPNEVKYIISEGAGAIKGTTSNATAIIEGFNTDWTRFDLKNIDGEFVVGENIFNTAGSIYWENPTSSFCSSSNDYPLFTFDNEIDCVNALHPEGHINESPFFGEPAFLHWFPLAEVTSTIQSVENNILTEGTARPVTREQCNNLLDGSHSKVKTAVWKTNGYWLDSGGFLSSDRKLQDNSYYQDFSYVIKSDVPVQTYREVLKKLVHPVGLKLFAEFSFQSTVDLKVEMPSNYVKLITYIFSYLDVAIDIWDQESEQHGTVGRAHTGFGVYLEDGFDEYVVEIMNMMDNRSALISAESWDNPTDHLSVNFEIDAGRIGTIVKEKLYTISWMNEDVRNSILAWPETTALEFTKQLKVLPIDEFPSATQELEIVDDLYSSTDGRMISAEIWEMSVYKALQKLVEWVDSFMPEADYAPEKSYKYFEANRESNRIHNIYGVTNDVIDTVEIQAFESEHEIHSHGEKNGFAPLVETVITKGLELPEMNVGASAFHVHDFNGEQIKNLIVHGKEATARGLSHQEARDLINRNAFEIPTFYGANLVCGGIMTPPLWGDWVASETDPRYNGIGECFNSQYTNEADCVAFFGDPMFWMNPMCSDQTSPDEATCHTNSQSWGYFTLESLSPLKGHASYFEPGEVVDRQRGRTADPLSRIQARQLIDGDITSVTLYDNIGKLDNGHPIVDEYDVTQGGTITNIHGEITSAHYHEYEVTYDADWENKTDWQNNPLTHGFIYTPVTTWLCFNYQPDKIVDPDSMGGMDFMGNQWPQNVFMEVSDEYVAGFLNNPDVTLQHNQVWSEQLNPNVDWVEIYSSNHIAQIAGTGDTGDLVSATMLTDQVTDIATIEAYPMDSNKVVICDQAGLIYLLDTITGATDGFMDLTSLNLTIGLGPFANYDERGLLGIAFHPDYVNNGKLYVYYMTEQGGTTGAWGYPLSSTVISEFTSADPATHSVDISTERVLMTIPQPDFNHNGGELAFGPDDMLYIGLGDGGSAGDTSPLTGHGGHGNYGNAQNPTNLLGCILRIDPTEDTVNNLPYTIPVDNPFTASIYGPDSVAYRPEIFAFGFRNPWRFSFDNTGRLWCADVGQDKFEEINIVESGGNYGWRVMEAYHYYEEQQPIIDQIAIDLGYTTTNEYLNDLKQPIHEYSHGTGISVCGGFVYRGTAMPELVGKYIFGDWSTTWEGTSGHLYTLEENNEGLSAHFMVLPNPTNGSTHSHTLTLTAAHVQFLQANPGSPVVVTQTDSVHSEFYVHTFTMIWSTADNQFHLVGQTNPEGHDILEFDKWSDDFAYIRKPLSFWDPVTEVVTLTTYDESLLTIGEDTDGELYFSTRGGIDTAQGTGPNNTNIYKLTETYSSVDIPNAPAQIPATEVAHVHGYKVTYDNENMFQVEEISDIEMQDWDEFWPIWSLNDPASHIHPVITSWTGVTDKDTIIGSSAGWYYNEENDIWEPYDTGADTPWTPETDDGPTTFYIENAPIVNILGANEYGENTHIHYFDSSQLDTLGANSDRLATPLTRIQAQELANGVVNEVIIYSSIINSGNRLHYHKYKILWNLSTQQFIANEIGEFWDEYNTGEYTMVTEDTRTHEHTLTVDGLTTHLGWNGTPLHSAPDVTLANAHDWDNLEGSEIDHLHSFNNTTLDTIGVNAGRQSLPITDEQATDLINGDSAEIMIYSSIANGDHYHGIRVTYDSDSLSFIAQDVEKWESTDGAQFFNTTPRSHAHATSVSNVISRPGFNESLSILPTFGAPGYPYPGGSHPHFFNNTVVGPFAWNNEIEHADGLSTTEAMNLIDGIEESVLVYDSIEGAHFHDYTIKWNDVTNKFYCSESTTWIRGGIEDNTQDTSKYYTSVVMNESEGLHWHNLTVDWNPNTAPVPQQTGGSIFVTRTTSVDEVLTSDPQITVQSSSTELSPETTTYNDTPEAGDTTVITTYSDLITTTTTETVTITTTTTTTTYYSDGANQVVVGEPVISNVSTPTTTTETVEDLTERKTFVNGILQANNPPVIWIQPSFIDGEGSHDHLLYDGCTLDSEGQYAGRICEPITLSQANELINAQDINYGFIFFDSPNGADAHYHGYTIKFNPNIGPDGEFVVTGITQFDRIPGTGETVHKFKLSGGYHDHDYWMSVSEYTSLLSGNLVITPQRDMIHATQYTHELTVSHTTGQYNIVSQTSDYDNHNLLTYLGSVALGGEWTQNFEGGGAGDHIHTTIIDDSNVWPVPV